jgi:hypothetical protein
LSKMPFYLFLGSYVKTDLCRDVLYFFISDMNRIMTDPAIIAYGV